MVQLTPAEAALFFGGVLTGIAGGIIGSFFVESFFQMFPKPSRVRALCIFMASLTMLALIFFVGLSYFSFDMAQPNPLPSVNNTTCISQNVTNIVNNYNVSVSEFYIDRKPQVLSIEELKNLMQKR